ncbi:hypothetical protein HQ520_16370 [bacterium]|nr:hypothetical protein [bacterium]
MRPRTVGIYGRFSDSPAVGEAVLGAESKNLRPVLRNPNPFTRDQVEKFDEVWILAGVLNAALIEECYKARGIKVDTFYIQKAAPKPSPRPIEKPAPELTEKPAPEAIVDPAAVAPLDGAALDAATKKLFPRARWLGIKKSELRAELEADGFEAVEKMLEDRKQQ